MNAAGAARQAFTAVHGLDLSLIMGIRPGIA
jgi:hypothetical protein